MSKKQKLNARETCIRTHVEDLKKYAKKNAEQIRYEVFGKDKHKQKKNKEDCDRGTGSGVARQCSKHLRTIFSENIIGDNQQSEWCVVSRKNTKKHNQHNECNLCHIDPKQYETTPSINISQAICNKLNGNINNDQHLSIRLKSFLNLHIPSDYPSNTKNTTLRINVNGIEWIAYYIKLTAFSSMLRASAPSGYKYKDRISLGRCIRIQGKSNHDLIFCIEKDENQQIDEEEEKHRPVVNMVGFWNLHKDGGIRNIIHLNEYQSLNVCFKFLIKPHSSIKTIDVELVCTGNSMKEQVLPLWQYTDPVNNINNLYDEYLDDIDLTASNFGDSLEEEEDRFGSSPEFEAQHGQNYSHSQSNSSLSLQSLQSIPPSISTTTTTTNNNINYNNNSFINLPPITPNPYNQHFEPQLRPIDQTQQQTYYAQHRQNCVISNNVNDSYQISQFQQQQQQYFPNNDVNIVDLNDNISMVGAYTPMVYRTYFEPQPKKMRFT